MKYLAVLFSTIAMISSSLNACVTYDPDAGTYTVDNSGCRE